MERHKNLARRMRKPARRGRKLAVQSWLWLTWFSACILAVLWVLQFALFSPFYYNLRRVEMRRTGREIVQAYETRGDFNLRLRRFALERNLRIILIDSAGFILGNYDGFESLFNAVGGRVVFDEEEVRTIAGHFNASDRDLCYISGDRGRVVYVARVSPSPSGERFLYVGSPIPPADATISVMAAQFVLITVILLLFAAAAAWLLSKRISRPILRLTESAKGLAKGEFRAEPGGRDYLEITQLRDELVRATQELTKAERYRRELLANVSHDLKTPLTIIRMYAEMLRDMSRGDAEKCGKIIGESDRLTAMVDELLEVSKLEQLAEGEIAMAPLRLDVLLRETADRFHALCERQGLRFALAMEPDVTVTGNADLLGRAVYNLIANAAHHAGKDRLVIVRLRVMDGFARVEVEDHGAGISPDELEHVWERYYKSGEHHERGTGLGLSIVQAALRLHGARFGAESEQGKGSTFWFCLRCPRHSQPPAAQLNLTG